MIDLIHGDCLEVLPTIPDASVNAVITDIPFGQINQEWDCLETGVAGMREAFRVVKKDGVVVTFATMRVAARIINEFPKLFRYELIWKKTTPVGFLDAKKKPLRNHEIILVFGQKLGTYNPQFTEGTPYTKSRSNKSNVYGKTTGVSSICCDGKRYPVSVLNFAHDADRHNSSINNKKRHPTQKPIVGINWLVSTYTNPGDTVLDPFMGSGTTGVACANLGRNFIGIEKEPEYFAIAEKRIHAAQAAPQQMEIAA